MGLPIWILQKKLAITFGCHQTINQSFSFQFCEVSGLAGNHPKEDCRAKFG
jgi:hypothetical protein